MTPDPLSEETDPLRRLRWQCRRGLLELDVLLGHFLETQYNQLSEQKKTKFAHLLQYSDQQLLYWLTDQDIPPVDLTDIIDLVKHLKISI